LTARFLSTDPNGRNRAVKQPQIWNRYAYAAGNPLKFVDPDGRDLKIVYDFWESHLTEAQQLRLQLAVRRAFARAGVQNVQSYVGGSSFQPVANKPTDRLVTVRFQAEPLSSGAFGQTSPGGNRSVVSTAAAPAGSQAKLNFLANVTAHEIGHASDALSQYSFDALPGAPTGERGTVMQKGTADDYSAAPLNFSPQDAEALERRLNDPCAPGKGCSEGVPQQ
jgi:hypothetical protein